MHTHGSGTKLDSQGDAHPAVAPALDCKNAGVYSPPHLPLRAQPKWATEACRTGQKADETPVDVQMHDGRGKNHQAYLWQYSRPGATVVFGFRLGRGRDGPRQFLGQFEGLLQTDGYAGYDQIGGRKMVHAGCWSHAERYFSEAVQLNPQDPIATAIVARIDELFAIDAEARSQRLSLEARDALRRQQSRPLLV